MKALEEGKKIRCLDWEEVIPSQKEETESSDVCKISINWMELIKTKWELYREPMSEWISVKDRLPEYYKKVLAYSSGAERTYICFRPQETVYNEHWSICEDSDCSCVGCTAPIDYWMPLAEPPA